MLKITHPITGAELQVANQDFSDKMAWSEAIRACNELGSGWRLPTKEELNAMYEQLHKKGQGGFTETCYWSSMEYDSYDAWGLWFTNGLATNYNKGDKGYVRAVRAF